MRALELITRESKTQEETSGHEFQHQRPGVVQQTPTLGYFSKRCVDDTRSNRLRYHRGVGATSALGTWAVFAVAGSVIAAAARLRVIAIAIALGEELVTVHYDQGEEHTQPVKQNTTIGKAIDSIDKSFLPVTYVISTGILVAASTLITQQHPETAAQLTPTWMKSCPISIAAFAYATGIVLTDAKTVERLLGQGRARTWVVRTGKIDVIATSIGFLLIGLAGLVILVSRIF